MHEKKALGLSSKFHFVAGGCTHTHEGLDMQKLLKEIERGGESFGWFWQYLLGFSDDAFNVVD
jgi:hypothetical protein